MAGLSCWLLSLLTLETLYSAVKRMAQLAHKNDKRIIIPHKELCWLCLLFLFPCSLSWVYVSVILVFSHLFSMKLCTSCARSHILNSRQHHSLWYVFCFHSATVCLLCCVYFSRIFFFIALAIILGGIVWHCSKYWPAGNRPKYTWHVMEFNMRCVYSAIWPIFYWTIVSPSNIIIMLLFFFCVFKFCFFLFVFASMRERTLFLAICTTFGPNEDFSRISTDFRLRLLARVTFDMGLSVSLSVLGGGMVVL